MSCLQWVLGTKLFSARAASVSSALGLTLKKVLQVWGHHPWGPAMRRHCPHLSPELSVQILVLQAHHGAHQSCGAFALLHFSPKLGPGVAEGRQKRVSRGLTSGLEDLPNIESHPSARCHWCICLSICSAGQPPADKCAWESRLCLRYLGVLPQGAAPQSQYPVCRAASQGDGGTVIVNISGYSPCAICSGICRSLAVGQAPCWVLSECQRASSDCHMLRKRRSKGDLCPGVIPGTSDSAKHGR